MKENFEWKSYTLLQKKECIPDVFELTFNYRKAFKPGQMVSLKWDIEHHGRLYSIVNGRNDPFLKILFDLKKEGYLTPRLKAMKPGSQLYISNPMGSFIGGTEEGYWIATGTGIAPFVSMLRSGLGTNKRLIHGARFLNQFYYQDEFKSALDAYIRCCTLEDDEDVFFGRLTFYLEMQDSLPHHFKYYLCGSSEMVVEVRDILIRKGIPYENILSEIYF